LRIHLSPSSFLLSDEMPGVEAVISMATDLAEVVVTKFAVTRIGWDWARCAVHHRGPVRRDESVSILWVELPNAAVLSRPRSAPQPVGSDHIELAPIKLARELL